MLQKCIQLNFVCNKINGKHSISAINGDILTSHGNFGFIRKKPSLVQSILLRVYDVTF